MTDAEAITLLDGLASESQAEEDALASARSEFSTAQQALNSATAEVDGNLASMDRHVRYAIDFFGA